MKIFIFTGPSLPPPAARAHWAAPVYLPPVAQGDIYRVAHRKPWGIGIIDGYFERTPAVWHKEILWALSKGIHVYGSASMGALRAAELAAFGMIGVGEIFDDYMRGVIEDDDEVTLAHAPARRQYRAVSEAMVNIRRTFAKAAQSGVVSAATADSLAKIGKALFYPLRTFEKILEEAERLPLPADELRAMQEWLPEGIVDQKRADALKMLDRVRADMAAHSGRKKVAFQLAYTDVLDGMRRELSQRRRRGKQHVKSGRGRRRRGPLQIRANS